MDLSEETARRSRDKNLSVCLAFFVGGKSASTANQ